MARRKPVDSGAAMAGAVDYLLREFRGLDLKPAADALAGDGVQFTGPIEPTYLVASVDARTELRAVADFVCSGVDDDQEIQAALDLASSGGRGTVQLTEGHFWMGTVIRATTIAVPAYVHLRGVGAYATRITHRDTDNFDLQITYAFESELSDFSIWEASCGG